MYRASAPQPQPASTTGSPGRSCSLRQTRSSLARCASSSVSLVGVVGAGVDHVASSQRGIEVVAEVVVMVNVAASLGDVVGPASRSSTRSTSRRSCRGASRERLDDLVEPAADSDAAGHVRLAEIQIRVHDEAQQRPPVVDDHVADRGRRRTRGQRAHPRARGGPVRRRSSPGPARPATDRAT